VILGGPVCRSILDTGIDTSKQQNSTTIPKVAGCSILWYSPATDAMPARIAGLGYSVTFTTNPADVNAANLANYQTLVVAFTAAGVLGPAQADIQNFVQAGHGLLIHQPNVAGITDYTPVGFAVNTANAFWCNFPGTPFCAIVDGTHPVTAGLLNGDLSGAFDQVATLDVGYHVLATSIACAEPALAVGPFGSGRVAWEDGNGNPAAIIPGSDVYWSNLFLWLCTGAATPSQTSTWGRLRSFYR
jgi:hypothetical protein